MEPFQGRLLVGVGKLLRIYDIGKKKMLRKCENKVHHIIYIYSIINDITIVFDSTSQILLLILR